MTHTDNESRRSTDRSILLSFPPPPFLFAIRWRVSAYSRRSCRRRPCPYSSCCLSPSSSIGNIALSFCFDHCRSFVRYRPVHLLVMLWSFFRCRVSSILLYLCRKWLFNSLCHRYTKKTFERSVWHVCFSLLCFPPPPRLVRPSSINNTGILHFCHRLYSRDTSVSSKLRDFKTTVWFSNSLPSVGSLCDRCLSVGKNGEAFKDVNREPRTTLELSSNSLVSLENTLF